MQQLNNPVKNWVLGLTGGIGCGKTAVSNILASQGVNIVDADIVARDVVTPGSEGLTAITAHFGKAILLPNGCLNRAELRNIIFENDEQKNTLNKLLHPLIRQQLLTQLNTTTSSYSVLVAPLLFENELNRHCQHTLLIDLPKEKQIERTMARDKISLAQTLSIIKSQMSREQKQQKADDILDNSQRLETVKIELLTLHQQYLNYAKCYKENV
ncbi:dephospho-CoA kinase [Pseudoalteromonas sp. MMG010]|uniref:dephospho-CoA kinase n=1 Tax=Pseudoalteromonas sp. MMG010 TaxID=2822685 RepID=UPI001B3A77ED|nr:dephospho-CoA kinase [Pseudoalteromonas sp. MMG010]MBQ4832753.1 dephospho-CoA kinase [Pseudoalteromonas sp. MMG010]